MRVTVESIAIPGNAVHKVGEFIPGSEEVFSSLADATRYMEEVNANAGKAGGKFFVRRIKTIEDNRPEEFITEVKKGLRILENAALPDAAWVRKVNGEYQYSDGWSSNNGVRVEAKATWRA